MLKQKPIQRDRWGRYLLDKEVFPRVTTIKGLVSGSGLLDWAAGVIAEAVKAEVEKFAKGEIDATGLCVALQSDKVLKAHDQIRDDAASFGTAVHKFAEAVALGDQKALDELSAAPEIRDVWADAEAFLGWVDARQPEWIANELTVYSREPSNYAGTCDALLKLDGRLWLADFKTSKTVYPDFALQMAAYANAEFWVNSEGQEVPIPQVSGAMVLHIRDGQCREVPVDIHNGAWSGFKSCLFLHKWLAERRRTK